MPIENTGRVLAPPSGLSSAFMATDQPTPKFLILNIQSVKIPFVECSELL